MKSVSRHLLLLSSGRTLSVPSLVLFCLFTGIGRGLLEALFFDSKALSPAIILSYVPFYTMMFLAILLILRTAGGLSESRTFRAPLAALFLGLFPPILDALISGLPNPTLRYGYYMELFRPQKIPEGFFFFYMPDFRLPLGETIVVWATILLSALYARLQQANWLRAALVGAAVYGLFFFHSYLLPSALRLWILNGAESLRGFDLNLFLPLSQALLSLLIYQILMKQSFGYLLKRALHILPFVFVFLAGVAHDRVHSIMPVHFGLLLFYLFFTMIVQNDYFDTKEDAHQKRRRHFSLDDVVFFTGMLTFTIVFLLAAGVTLSLFLIVIMICSLLYSFPFYRGKGKIFPTMKFEGIWGLMSFLAGAIPFVPEKVGVPVLIKALLVFGGWSLFALLKDVKDIRADYHAGQSSLYIVFYRKGWGLLAAHRWLLSLCTLALLFAPAYYGSIGRILPGVLLSVSAAAFVGVALKLKLKVRYQGILAALNVYLAIISLTGFNLL